MTVVALLQPGAMGARLGGELVRAGHEVRWLAPGRSAATTERAEQEGLQPAHDVAELVADAQTVLCVLPPQLAVETAELVAGAGFAGTYVDANPLSPTTLATVRRTVEAAGARFVDAGVVGPPPRAGGRTSLYLAGDPDLVGAVSDLFDGTEVTPVFAGPTVGQASAAKQAYALFNKGRMVLAATAARLAEAHGVSAVLAGESGRPGAELLGELDGMPDRLAEVAWRWAPEMDELAEALAAAGVDPAATQGMAADLHRFGPGRSPG